METKNEEYRSKLQTLMSECRKVIALGIIDPSDRPEFMKDPNGLECMIGQMKDLLMDNGDPEVTMDDIREVESELIKIFGEYIPGIETKSGEAVYEEFRCPEKILRAHLEGCSYTCSLTEAAKMLIQAYGYNRKTKMDFNMAKYLRESNLYGMRKIGKEDFLKKLNEDPFRLVGNYPFSPVTPRTEEFFVDYVLSRMDARSLRDGDPYVESADEKMISLDNGHKIIFNWLDDKVEEYYVYPNHNVDILILKTIHSSQGRVDYIRYAVFIGEQGQLELDGFKESETDFSPENNPEDVVTCRFYAWAYKFLTTGVNPWKSMEDYIPLCYVFKDMVSAKLNGLKPVFEIDRTSINFERPSIEGVELSEFPANDCVTYIARGKKLEEKTKVIDTEVDFQIKKSSSGRIPSKMTMAKVAKHLLLDLGKRSGAFCIKDSSGNETQWDMGRNGTEYTLIEKGPEGQNVLVFDLFQGKMVVKECSFR